MWDDQWISCTVICDTVWSTEEEWVSSCFLSSAAKLSSLWEMICWSNATSCLPKIVKLALTFRFLFSKVVKGVNSVAMVFALGWWRIDLTLALKFFPFSFLCFNVISRSLSSEISSSRSFVRLFILLHSVASPGLRCSFSQMHLLANCSSPRGSIALYIKAGFRLSWHTD